MHHFTYRNRQLYCEDIAIRDLAEKVGTPFYLYSHATLKRHFETFDKAFKGIDRLVCFSAKANTNLAVLSLFRGLGSGLDIVSGGELFRGLKAGFRPDHIVYSGVGKRVDEIDYALETGILMFNVESLEELSLINQRAGLLGRKAPIAIRVNPDVDPKTHPYISTGLKKNKFGIDIKTSVEGYKLAAQMEHIEVVGIDCHIGSQIIDPEPFKDALNSIKILMDALKASGISIKYLDMGGGLGIVYDDEHPLAPGDYASPFVNVLKDVPVKLILEPGRVIVGNAGILVTRVLYRKTGESRDFVVVDAGMNDLLRPAIYKAYHGIQPVEKTERVEIKADVVGPICESADFLAQDRRMTDVAKGDLLAVMSAGAYGFTMASNYCSRLKVAEVMVKGSEYQIVKARQNYEDLIAGESVPAFI
ncbi:MAG: diaminopimelate decarboxylase [Desulfobacterales bacterium]|nr:diaminopimelate decarboxylase [Desulfobacterales bacterium]MDD4071833.1 diaminopimelate decarboxylase [Desulfobacterales bacterium]MDD4392540.1 diaminopimelate decarboxylase [Desulfobacterales bacterium]